MFNHYLSRNKQTLFNKLLKASSLLFLSSAFLAPASADILSTIDFESAKQQQPIKFAGDKSSGPRHPGLMAGGFRPTPTIVTTDNGVKPRSGKYMMKAHLKRWPGIKDKYDKNKVVGKYRSSATIRSNQNYAGKTERGKDYWIGFSMYLPADWSMNYNMYRDGKPIKRDDGSIRYVSGVLFDFHDLTVPKSQEHRRGLPFIIKHTKDGFMIGNRSDKCYAPPKGQTTNKCMTTKKNKIKTFREYAPMRLGQWNDFVIHVKWSPNSDGVIETWVNGKQEVNVRGANFHSEHTDKMYPYFKIGLYEATWWATKESRTFPVEERTAYFDEIRIGENSNYKEVAPKGSVTPTEDKTAPSKPSNLKASNITTNSVKLNWNASTDNVGVSAYEVHYNGKVKAASGTSTTLTGLTPNVNYSIKVRAKDAAGNTSAFSDPETAVTDSDTSPTSLSIKNIKAKVGSSKAIILWDTNIPTKGMVVFYAKGVNPKHLKTSKLDTKGYLEIPNSLLTTGRTYTYYVKVTENGGKSLQSSNFTFITNNKPVEPTPSFNLNYMAASGGKLIGVTKQTIKKGGAATTITAVANTGFAFVKWSDGLTSATRTDKNINRDATLTATFSRKGITVPVSDFDKDGIPDSSDPDDDNDSVLDVNDAFPFNKSESIDTDNDGIGNNTDLDDDNDGYSDAEERTAGTNPLDSNDKPTLDNGDNTTDNEKEEKSDESAGSFPIGLLMLGLLALLRRK